MSNRFLDDFYDNYFGVKNRMGKTEYKPKSLNLYHLTRTDDYKGNVR